MLRMDTEWHPRLVERVKELLDRIKYGYQLDFQDNLNMRIKKTGLPVGPLIAPGVEKRVIHSALRVETIHGVKGESLDAVLYLADREHVKAMVSGTGTELGRIGYVAVTRARDLFWLGITEEDAAIHRDTLRKHTFVERNYDPQLDLPLASSA